MLEDLEAALQLGLIVLAAKPAERPSLRLDHVFCVRLLGARSATERQGGQENHHRQGGPVLSLEVPSSLHSAATLAGCAASFLPSTASVMEPGSFLGFSSQPTTGMTMRKWAK